jgi:hypothetical protein
VKERRRDHIELSPVKVIVAQTTSASSRIKKAAAYKRAICVEVTWTPKEGIAGEDITKNLTIDPDDLQPGDKMKWRVE